MGTIDESLAKEEEPYIRIKRCGGKNSGIAKNIESVFFCDFVKRYPRQVNPFVRFWKARRRLYRSLRTRNRILPTGGL
jgi:hypothetical protein